jgi:hypothetical protein
VLPSLAAGSGRSGLCTHSQSAVVVGPAETVPPGQSAGIDVEPHQPCQQEAPAKKSKATGSHEAQRRATESTEERSQKCQSDGAGSSVQEAGRRTGSSTQGGASQ